MTRDTILKSTFAVFSICMVVGLAGKILHYPYSEIILSILVILAIIFSSIALMEIWSSKQIQTKEKLIWTTFLIFPNGLAMFLYLFNGRRRVLRVYRTGFNSVS